MLRVGLDLRATEADFKEHAGRGTGRYVRELALHMQKLSEDQQVELSPIFSKDLIQSSKISNLLPFGKRTFQSQWSFPRSVARLENDLVHFFSHGDAAAWGGLKQVVSVLDLIPLKFPDLYSTFKGNLRFKFARYLEYQAVKNATGLVAISEATKKDVIEILKVAPEKIVVTPLAADGCFCVDEKDEVEELKLKYKLPTDRPMILYVGGIDPRKNALFMCEVFAELLKNEHLTSKPILVLAGRIQKDDQYPKLVAQLKSQGIEDEVFQLGFVPDKDLPSLYRAADISIFPSLYEGFGLPVLESMACGTPVVAGNNSSIPEVVGDAFPLFEDLNTKEWVQGIERYFKDADFLTQASARGVERAKSFSWESTAEKTIAAYKQFDPSREKGA